MNISELYSLTHWVEKHIVTSSIVEKYQALYDILQQHVSSSQPRQSFARQRDELLDALLSVPVEQLSQDQLTFLAELGIAQAVSQQGVERVEDTLFRNVIDVATSAQTIGFLLEVLQQGIGRSSQINQGLQDMNIAPVYTPGQDVLMRIGFCGKSAMANVADFRHWGEVWHDIGYGVAFAQGETAEDVKIVGAASGSVVMDLSVSTNVATTASDIILAALQLTEKVQDINQKAEELRRLQLNNNKLVMDLEKEAEFEIRSGVENISATIIKKLGLRKNGEGDKITALMKSVKHLIYFIENGGQVDFVINVIPQDDLDSARQVELQAVFQQIRTLKQKLMHQTEETSIIEAA